MVLDVTAKDGSGIQVFGETKIFNMVGYTERNRQGQTTLDNWLIRSWDDNAIPPGKSTHVFELAVPVAGGAVQVEATLTYQVGDSLTPMTEVNQSFSLSR